MWEGRGTWACARRTRALLLLYVLVKEGREAWASNSPSPSCLPWLAGWLAGGRARGRTGTCCAAASRPWPKLIGFHQWGVRCVGARAYAGRPGTAARGVVSLPFFFFPLIFSRLYFCFWFAETGCQHHGDGSGGNEKMRKKKSGKKKGKKGGEKYRKAAEWAGSTQQFRDHLSNAVQRAEICMESGCHAVWRWHESDKQTPREGT